MTQVVGGLTPAPVFCSDHLLGYTRSRTPFRPGAGLTLDATYRLAHLPLLAPDHPDCIRSDPARGYEAGRHGRIFSLVVPVPENLLTSSPAFQELNEALRSSRFGAKLAWDLLPRRRGKLHATICGSLGLEAAPTIGAERRRALAEIGPVSFEVRGLFSGNVNVGRLYLRLYPECRNGTNPMREIQSRMGRPQTDLYPIGLHNLLDHLDPAEAADLARLVESWWDRVLLRFESDRLWLLGASDDLVLDSAIVETVPLA